MASPNPPWLLAAASAAALIAAAPAQAESHRFHADHVLGTSLDLVVVGASELAAREAAAAVRSEIDRLDGILSGWRSDSELAQLNAATAPLAVSDTLFEVVSACEDWRARCGGAFSARLGAVEALWRSAEADGRTLDRAVLRTAATRAEAAVVGLDRESRSISRPEGVTFAIDALAKGYIIDRALEAGRAAAPQARGMLVDIGGDLRCWGEGPGGAWRIGLASGEDADNVEPTQTLALRDAAVATSGPGARDRVIAGGRFSHLLSPADGRAVGSTATVLAHCAADADALATALAAMGPDAGLALAERLPGVEARIVDDGGRAYETPGWVRIAAARPTPARPAARPAAPVSPTAWPVGFGVKVDLTILPPKSRSAYWPFVVVWVSDAQGRLVRTVSAWGDKTQYVGENWIWWAAFLKKYKYDDMHRFTRPSRRPGSYSVVWDGRDDQGAPAPRGRYTIHVESVREDGPRTHQSIALDIGTQPVVGSAVAEDELGPSTVRFGPVR